MTSLHWTSVFWIAMLLTVAHPLELIKRKDTPPFLRNQRIYNTASGSSSYSSNSITTASPYSDSASSYSSNSEQYASASNNVASVADSAAAASAATSAAAAAAAASAPYSSYSPATTYSASSTYTQPVAAASYSGSGYSDTYSQSGSGSYGSYPSASHGSYGSGSHGSYGSGSGSHGSYGSGSGSYGSYDSGSYGGPSYSVSYPSGYGSTKGAFGPETLSFLSSLAPSLLLSSLLLPLAISSLLAASNSTSLFGRRKRSNDDFSEDSEELAASLLDDSLTDLADELYSDTAPVAKIIDTLDDQLATNGNVVKILEKNGLIDAKNQCLDKMVCLGASAGRGGAGSKAEKLKRIVDALDKNGELPEDLKSRLSAAKAKSSFCSAFICTSS